MKYTNFINQISHCQTGAVQALSFPNSCAMRQIPDAFEILIPDLIKILHNNHDQLCWDNEVLHIFSMQSVSSAIMSTWPLKMNRIINFQVPKLHACYSIDFLSLSTDKDDKPKTWHGAKTVVVDCTMGEVMDAEHYCAKVFGMNTRGSVLGLLSLAHLEQAWQLIRDEQRQVLQRAA